MGWLSPSIHVLMSNDTPLVTGPLSPQDLSNVGSISSLGSLFGTFVFGYLASFIGCKRAMVFLGLPSIIFWLLIFFGDSLCELLIARFVMGCTAGGVQSGIIIYVSEISNDK